MYYLFNSESAAQDVAHTLRMEYVQRGRLYVIFTEEIKTTVETVVDLMGLRDEYISRPNKSNYSDIEDYQDALADWYEMEREYGLE